MPFNSDLNNSDVLENFDFEQFLQTTDRDFNFDPSTFETGDGIEIGGGIEIRPEEKPKGPFAGIDLDSVDGVLGRGRPEWWQREREQGDSRMADMEVVDRLVFLWTTVKSLSDVSNSECSKVFHPEVSLIENSEGLDPLMFLETH